jgi:hypothetical protein
MADTLFNSKAPGIMKMLMDDFLMTKEDAAAILGNIGTECAGFQKMQEERPTIVGSRGGFGWCQWTGPRRLQFEAYCARNKLDPISDTANYKFMFNELKGSEAGALTKLKAANTLNDKVIAFEEAYLRAGTPHFIDRQNWAAKALAAFNASSYALTDAPYDPPLRGPTLKEPTMSSVLPSANTTVDGKPMVTVATQSPAASQTNWASLIGIAGVVFAWFHIPISSDLMSQAALAIPALTSIYTIVRRTWFTKTISTAAAGSAAK